jgi:hypothetical protein
VKVLNVAGPRASKAWGGGVCEDCFGQGLCRYDCRNLYQESRLDLFGAELALLAMHPAIIVLYGPNPFSCPVIGPLLYCHIGHDAIAKTGDVGDRYELRSESSVALSR